MRYRSLEMPKAVPNLDEILRLDRAHVIHPITEFRKQEKHGSKIFVSSVWHWHRR
jgi:hypothetical protein